MPYVTQKLISDKVGEAIAVAIEAHNFQIRKGECNAPYVCHPIEVAARLMKSGIKDEVVLCAAVLHDVLEDTDTQHNDLLSMFGDEVADIVFYLSDGEWHGKEKPDKKTRKRMYAKKIKQCKDKRIVLISAIDKLCNAEDYIAGALTNPQTPENAALNLDFYGELMPSYIEALMPYPRLFDEMKEAWLKLQQIFIRLK